MEQVRSPLQVHQIITKQHETTDAREKKVVGGSVWVNLGRQTSSSEQQAFCKQVLQALGLTFLFQTFRPPSDI